MRSEPSAPKASDRPSSTPARCVECDSPVPPTVGKGRPRQVCSKACANRRRTRLAIEQSAEWPQCAVAECGSRARSAKAPYCEKHYGRVRRGVSLSDRPRRGSIQCVVDECELAEYSQATHLCRNHHLKYRAFGDPRAPHGNRKEVITYFSLHDRLRRERGSASAYTCPCGAEAKHWSYDHLDPEELLSEEGLPYSLDPGHYIARCVPCHVRFDYWRNQ